jgi:catechol 2,3-dioxygenase-like lactoylglutathione lyase family enzyme
VTTQINHVSVSALDLDQSVGFYVDLLGATPLAAPNFGVPVRWLAIGRTQLHLFEQDLRSVDQRHFAVTVDDLEPVYRAARRRDAFDRTAFGNHLVELPGDVVQLYVRDPAHNLVEIDCLGSHRLPEDMLEEVKAIWDLRPQSRANMSARLTLA